MSDPTVVAYPVGGLDETTDDAFVPPNAMRVCDNVVFPDPMTASKRSGYEPFATTLAYARALATDGRNLLVVDGVNAWSVYGTPPGDGLYPRGRVSPCMVARTLFASSNITRNTSSPDTPIVPRGSIGYDPVTGYSVRAWCNGLAVSAQIYDEATGAFVTAPVMLNAAAGALSDDSVDNPRVCIVGSVAFVLYADVNATTHIQYCAIDLTNIAGGWTGQAPLANSVWDAFATQWDAETLDGTALVALLTCVDTNGSVNLATYTPSGTTLTWVHGATAEAVAGHNYNACALRGNATDGIGLTYVYTTGAGPFGSVQRWSAYTTGLASVQAPTTIRSWSWVAGVAVMQPAQAYAVGVERITGQGSGNTGQWMTTLCVWFVVAEDLGGGKTDFRVVYAHYWNVRTFVNSALLLSYGPLLSHQQVTKPRALRVAGGTRIYQVLEYATAARRPLDFIVQDANGIPNGLQTTLLCELTYDPAQSAYSAPLPCATSAVQSAGDLPAASFDLLVGPGSTLLTIGTEVDQSKKTSLSSVTYDFAHPGLWLTTRLADWMFLAGGMPMIYDGSQLCEQGFLTPPAAPLVIVAATAGGVTTNATCQYLVVEVQQDDSGNIHRSAPSNIKTVDASAGSGASQINVYLLPRRVTLRQTISRTLGEIAANPIRLQIYRNTATTQDVFYLVAEIQNDPTELGVITFLDTTSDATLSSRTEVYTTGGAVEGDAPPSLSTLCVHADRIMGIGEDGRTMWFTTAYVRGECPRFSTAFTIDWPVGPLTATWSLEQRLHAATADRIYYLLGEGPSDNGVGVDWTTPQLWTADLGVVDARGVAAFERGVVLSTQRGLYLEGRDGSYTWLSKCRRTLAAYPVVTSITPLGADGAVRITLKASDTLGAAGTTLHWDYRHEKWATHSLLAPAGFDSSALVGGRWYGLLVANASGTPTGTLQRESASSHLDAGATWVTVTLTWGWHVPGEAMLGWGEVANATLLARRQTPHGIAIAWARDYASANDPNARSWSDAQITAFAAAGPEQLRASLQTPTCEAVSVTVTDAAPTTGTVGAGTGATIVALQVRTTPKRGEFLSLPKDAQQ